MMRNLGLLASSAFLLSHLPRSTSVSVKLDGPLINISGDQGGGYPRAVALKDGTVLATYSHTGNGIVVRASHDQGATWDAPSTVLAPVKHTDENNQFLFQKASGEILCAYRRHVHDNNDKLIQVNLDVSHSTDGGKSWSVLSSIVSETPNATIKGEWEPFLFHNSVTEKLEVYWAHEMWNTPEKENAQQDAVKKISPDGGKTWGPMLTMTGKGLTARDGMPNLAALDATGKNLMLVYETNRDTPQLKVWASTSDGGATWGNAKKIFDPEGKYAGGPGIVNFNGTVVVSFMTDMDAPAGSKDKKMKAITSTDKGKSWSGATTVMNNGSWGGISIVGDGMLITAGHEGHAYGQKIKLVD